MLNVDNFRGKNLDLSKCQGTRQHGDNPLTHIPYPTLYTHSPTFYHRYGYVDSIKTTLFPLTIVWGPLFYYIRFPDKKGGVSTRRGETTIGSVIEGFYPPSTSVEDRLYEWTDLLFNPLVRWQLYVLSYGRQLKVVESGNSEWTYVPYLICQVEPDFSTPLRVGLRHYD